MHPQAADWVKFVASQIQPKFVMDQGGRNVNGGIRQYFPQAEWLSVDITEGDDVDVVADCAYYTYLGCDAVVSTELFEHTPKVREIIQCAYDSLVFGGSYIITTAGLNRPPHNAHGLPVLLKGEYYCNINPYWLLEQLRDTGFQQIIIDVREDPSDVRVWAIK